MLERPHDEFYVEGIYSMRFVTGKIGFYETQAHQITALEKGLQVAPPRRHRKIFHVMRNHGSNIMVQIFSKDTYYGGEATIESQNKLSPKCKKRQLSPATIESQTICEDFQNTLSAIKLHVLHIRFRNV